MEFGFEHDRQDLKSDGTPGPTFQKFRLDERAAVRNAGSYIFDPRLISSNAGITVGLVQERNEFGGTASTRLGTLLGYSFDSAILPEKPYSLFLFANRSQNVITQPFGGRSDLTAENRGATLWLRELLLQSTMTFSGRQEVAREDTTVAGQTVRRDERRTVGSFDLTRGFEVADLSARYEFTDLEDRANRIGSFRAHEGSLFYSRDFGEDLNKRWDSRVRFFDRSGFAKSTFLDVDESLRIDHAENLFTDYRYLLSRVTGIGGTTTTHTGIARVQHQLYRNLTTRLQADARFQSLPGGQRDVYGGQVDLAYQRGIPWGGRATVGLGGRFQLEDQRFRTTETFVPQESHTAATPFAVPIPLNNAFVLAANVVVTKTAFGPVPPFCLPAPPGPPTPLAPGRDYTLQVVGNTTQIVPLPCSPGVPGINPGDTIAVDYRFEVSPSLLFATQSWYTNLGVDFNWIALSYTHDQTDQHVLSGRDGRFLEGRRSDRARLDLRREGERWRAQAGAEFEHTDATRLSFTSWRFNQFLSYRLVWNLNVSVSASEAFFQFSRPARTSETYVARGDLEWNPLPGLLITGFAGLHVLRDSQIPMETFREAGVQARFSWGRLDVTPSYTFNTRERGTSESTEHRFLFRLIRRF